MSPIQQFLRSREIPRLTCLRAFAGRNSIKSGVFDASTLTATTISAPLQYQNIWGSFLQTLQVYNLPVGTFLGESQNDITKVAAYTGWGANANDVQTVSTSGAPTGGSFTLTFNGQTTSNIPYNATAAQVLTALTALSNIGSAANVATSGGPLPTGVVVTFQGLLGNSPQSVMTTNSSGLTGGATPTASVAHTTTGTFQQHILGVFDGPDRDFFGNVVGADEVLPMYFHECDFDVSKLQNWLAYGATAKTALTTCVFR
jgi:hypothetical protein